MLRPSGFVEYSPSQQLIFDQLTKIIAQTYEKFSYTHIQTPAVELNEVLLSKNGEETGKQIFGLYGLAQGSEDTKEYSLHFDLTVPFARYILDRENELTFPFKRYQMQPVRRGERAQKGRFREFTQCDIDVIRRKDVAGDYFFYDAEVIFTLSQALTAILTQTHIKDKAIMHISNRKLIFGFLETVVTDEQMPFVTSLIDKYKKIGHEKFKASLQDAKLSSEQIEKICEFITMKCDAEAMGKIASFADTPLFKEGYAQLEQLMTYLETFKKSFGAECEYVIDLQILRGLDYYTGTVFEAFLEQDTTLGSICGGGRYGELTGFIDPKRDTYAGVGGSIGLSRILSKIFEEQAPTKNTVAEYLFLNFPETFEETLQLAAKFIAEGKKVEIYPSNDKLGKQFGLADKRGIPYVVIFGEGEKAEGIYKIKELQTGKETKVPLD